MAFRGAKCPVLAVKPEEIRELIDIHDEDEMLSLRLTGNEMN